MFLTLSISDWSLRSFSNAIDLTSGSAFHSLEFHDDNECFFGYIQVLPVGFSKLLSHFPIRVGTLFRAPESVIQYT